jgi:parvulin-like peptidyl-prolyl isomerase
LVLTAAASIWAPYDRAWAVQNEASTQFDFSLVARVNGEPVTRAELERMLANPLERQELREELGAEATEGKDLDRLALRKLIDRRLILQEARRRNLTVTEQELDQAITALRRRFQDLKSLGVWMKEQGLDDQSLVETLRAEMLAARVRVELVEGVRVSEQEVQQYYETHKEDIKTEEVWIQVIVVKDQETAKEVLKGLQKGEDFGRLARKWSVGLRAAEGGDTGWVDSETLWPPLREAVGTLKAREAVGPLPRGSELLIVRLQDRRPGRTKSLAGVRPEIERRLLPAARQRRVQAWLAEQEKKSKIEIFP